MTRLREDAASALKRKAFIGMQSGQANRFLSKQAVCDGCAFMLLTEVPFAQKVWALPFMTVLCPSERYDEERGIRHRKLTRRARQAILLIKRWLPKLDLVFVGDSSYAVLDLLNAVRDKVTVVSKLRLDAAFYRKAKARRKGQLGRGRSKGNRLPTLQAVIANPKTKWKTVSIKNWYREPNQKIEISSGKCVWYDVGKEAVSICRVMVRDFLGKFETQALLSTKIDASPKRFGKRIVFPIFGKRIK